MNPGALVRCVRYSKNIFNEACLARRRAEPLACKGCPGPRRLLDREESCRGESRIRPEPGRRGNTGRSQGSPLRREDTIIEFLTTTPPDDLEKIAALVRGLPG